MVEQDSVTHLTQEQPSKVDHFTSTELDFTEQTPSDGVENIHASTDDVVVNDTRVVDNSAATVDD